MLLDIDAQEMDPQQQNDPSVSPTSAIFSTSHPAQVLPHISSLFRHVDDYWLSRYSPGATPPTTTTAAAQQPSTIAYTPNIYATNYEGGPEIPSALDPMGYRSHVITQTPAFVSTVPAPVTIINNPSLSPSTELSPHFRTLSVQTSPSNIPAAVYTTPNYLSFAPLSNPTPTTQQPHTNPVQSVITPPLSRPLIPVLPCVSALFQPGSYSAPPSSSIYPSMC